MLSRIKEYALKTNVPIITDAGLLFLKTAISTYKIKDVLEIGTAVGYSALAMASYGCFVDTFERDEEMISQAMIHLDMFDEKKQVKLIPFDALKYTSELRSYDLIFIDAAKAQYEKFFEKYTKYLREDGIVICDNLSFHDLKPENVNRHTRQLLRKIDTFKNYLTMHPDFNTTFFDVGDGMSISQRKLK
ncbi:MAG: O-methyltransferase [Acholeplasmataceae bacterium]|nr:O-methyltransferase [Acholeplasmataceae bacterium]